MKQISKIQLLVMAAVLCVKGASGAGTAAPVKAAPVKAPPAKSTFVMPISAKDGRDPFYPESNRVFEANVPPTAHTVEIATLKVQGYSIVNNDPMVIINKHPFMINDEGDVLTTGGRVHVRCLDIKPTVAIIEANGVREYLHF